MPHKLQLNRKSHLGNLKEKFSGMVFEEGEEKDDRAGEVGQGRRPFTRPSVRLANRFRQLDIRRKEEASGQTLHCGGANFLPEGRSGSRVVWELRNEANRSLKKSCE